MLTIKNPQKLIGQKYSDVFNIIGVHEHTSQTKELLQLTLRGMILNREKQLYRQLMSAGENHA